MSCVLLHFPPHWASVQRVGAPVQGPMGTAGMRPQQQPMVAGMTQPGRQFAQMPGQQMPGQQQYRPVQGQMHNPQMMQQQQQQPPGNYSNMSDV